MAIGELDTLVNKYKILCLKLLISWRWYCWLSVWLLRKFGREFLQSVILLVCLVSILYIFFLNLFLFLLCKLGKGRKKIAFFKSWFLSAQWSWVYFVVCFDSNIFSRLNMLSPTVLQSPHIYYPFLKKAMLTPKVAGPFFEVTNSIVCWRASEIYLLSIHFLFHFPFFHL